MTLPLASQGADELQPPAVSGTYAIANVATTTSAASLALSLSQAPSKGGAWFTFQPRGGDVYVRFGATATTGTTTTNGLKIADGAVCHVWITPATAFVDHICSAASKSLVYWQSSPNYAGRT